MNKYSMILRFTIIMAIILLGVFSNYLISYYFNLNLLLDGFGAIVFDLLFVLLIIGPIILYFLRSLYKNEKQYLDLINHIPDGVFIQKDQKIIDSNERGIRMLGGEKLEDIIGQSIYNFICIGEEKSLAENTQLVSDLDKPSEFLEQKLTTLKGEEVEVEATAVPIIYNGEKCILTIDRDVTERNRKDREHQAVQQRYEMISNNMHDFIALLNEEGGFEYASPSYVRLLGYQLDESKSNINIFDFIFHEHKPLVKELMDEVVFQKDVDEGKRIDFRLDHPTLDKIVWVEAEIINVANERDHNESLLFIARDITKRKLLEEKLKQLAYYDSLTDLPNRKMLERSLKSAVARARRFNHKIITLFIDLDGFKSVNDSLGHEAGDHLLKVISERFVNCVREEDIVARLGGDEFIIVLEEANELDIGDMMERLFDHTSKPIIIGDEEVTVSPSIGVAIYPDHGETVDDLLNKADQAMYFAKHKGKKTYQIYSDELPEMKDIKSSPFTKFINQFIK